MEILVMVGQWALPVAAAALVILAIAGAKKLLDKMGVARSDVVDGMIDRYVRMGINAAEVMGRKFLESKSGKVAGGTKKAKAVQVVLNELDQSGIKGVAQDLISDRIEHWLEVDGKEPGTPSDPPQVPVTETA